MDYKKMGKRIRGERIKAGLTQENLAEAVELSAVYIGQIERGERKLSLETLVKIANKLKVSIDYLIKDSTISNPDARINELLHLLEGHTNEEICLVIDATKAILSHIKDNTISRDLGVE